MPWIISSVATILSIISMWMYGNKSWKAPIISIIICLIWVFYDIKYDQFPLLIPTFINISVAIRNLIVMRR